MTGVSDMPFRMAVQPVADLVVRRRVASALEIARREHVELTTPEAAR